MTFRVAKFPGAHRLSAQASGLIFPYYLKSSGNPGPRPLVAFKLLIVDRVTLHRGRLRAKR